MPMVLDLCDSVGCWPTGAASPRASARHVQSDPAVLDAYLGADFPPMQGRRHRDRSRRRVRRLRRRGRAAGTRPRGRPRLGDLHRRSQRRGQVDRAACHQRPGRAAQGRDRAAMAATSAARHPAEIIDAGVVQVPQHNRLFPSMTVHENVLLGGFVRRRNGKYAAQPLRRARGDVPDHRRTQSRPAGNLSGGQRRDRSSSPGP